MKAFLYFDTASDSPDIDLNVICKENGKEEYLGDEVDVPAGQFADWQFVLSSCKETDEEFIRVQREMRMEWEQAHGRLEYQKPRVPKARSTDPADWWKE
jgi:hypothetical protein